MGLALVAANRLRRKLFAPVIEGRSSPNFPRGHPVLVGIETLEEVVHEVVLHAQPRIQRLVAAHFFVTNHVPILEARRGLKPFLNISNLIMIATRPRGSPPAACSPLRWICVEHWELVASRGSCFAAANVMRLLVARGDRMG